MKRFPLPFNLTLWALRGTFFLAAGLVFLPPCAFASGGFEVTGSLNTARSYHAATLLPNGMVLVAGGLDSSGVSASAELYDPALASWSATGSLNTARFEHTATLLSNGMVLVAGGLDSSFLNPTASAELYDPASGSWSATGSLNTARYNHTATLLPNGIVLVAGGVDGGVSASAELYDPALGSWSATGSLNTARWIHTATLLPNGMALVAGGYDDSTTLLASAELYDPDLAPPLITSPLVATGTVGLPFSYQFEAIGATSLAVSDLPPDLRFDPALRAIVGNPTVEGTFQVGLSASNSAGTTNANLVLTVQPLPTSGPVLMSITSATGRTGSPFDFQVLTSGGTSEARLSATDLPPELSIDPVTGEISGTPTLDGSFPVTLTVTDGSLSNTATLQLTFTSDPAVPVIVSSNSAFLVSGLFFEYQIIAPSSEDPRFTVIGQLPPGLVFDPDTGPITGIISGTPNLGFSAQPTPKLGGGIISNVQGWACTSSGCATTQLVFYYASTGALNISTRANVGTNTDVLIGGFIIDGTAPIKVILRGIGPSLTVDGTPGGTPLPGRLLDPSLELHSGTSTLGANESWKVNSDPTKNPDQSAAILATGLAPTKDLESAILALLNPGLYTVIMSGVGAPPTGIGLVAVDNLGTYSFISGLEGHLANISTRGTVQTGANVMIGGFINRGVAPIKILVRAIGPSLPLSNTLANPMLELHNSTGALIATNDDWMTTQKVDIMATGIPPLNDRESAIVTTLPATIPPVQFDSYTAIVGGAGGTSGVALVEVYFGSPCLGTLCP